jgi:hypothetical protein
MTGQKISKRFQSGVEFIVNCYSRQSRQRSLNRLYYIGKMILLKY